MGNIYIRERIGIDDLFDLHSLRYISFCGHIMRQTHSSLFILEQVLVSNPDITRIVELGTAHGGLALFFGLHMFGKGGRVLTLDVAPVMSAEWYRLASFLNIEFRKRDIWDIRTIMEVSEFIKLGRALIFIDGGDKPKELTLYAPCAKPNDLIMIHDYASEIHPKQLTAETLSLLEPFRQEEFDALKTWILSMRRK